MAVTPPLPPSQAKPSIDGGQSTRLPGWVRALSAVRVWSLPLVLGLGVALAAITVRTPAPVAAPSAGFSAERAMADVRAIGRMAHPTGAPGGEVVRRHIFDRLESFGLLAEVHVGQATRPYGPDRSRLAAASVQNIVAVMPGRDPQAPALLIMAHHDSVPNSPGAADDGAGVATLLETARSLATDAPHARPVIFLVTDGEELGLLGAQAFFDTDPLARRVGAVINMDTRGDAGRAAMFQVGPQSGAVLDAYRRHARAPFAHSLTALVARILPNDTDFTVAAGAGLPGLNFAFIGDQLAYHTPLSTPEHLSRGALQSMGGQVLPVARALADAPELERSAAPSAWTDVFGLGLLVLPWWAGALLWLWAAGLGAYAGWLALKAKLTHPWEIARGAGLTVGATLAAGLTLSAAAALLGTDGLRIYGLLGRYELLFAGCSLLALGSTLAVLTIGAQRRLAGPWGLWLGALALGLLLSFGLQIALPSAAPVVLVPMLLGALGAVGVFTTGTSERWGRIGLAAAGALAVVALGWLGGLASELFVAAGPFLPALLCVFVALGLMVAAPFASLWCKRRLGWAGSAALVTGGIVALLVVGLSGPTAARPRPTTLLTVEEGATGPAFRVAPGASLDPWTTAALGAKPGHAPLEPLFARPVWTAPVRSPALPAPGVETLRIEGRLILHVRPGNSGRRLTLWLKSPAPLTDPRLNAKAANWTFQPNRWSRIDFHAPPPEGFTISLAAPDAIDLQIVAAELTDDAPKGAPPPPPMPKGWMPFGDSGATIVVTRVHLRT